MADASRPVDSTTAAGPVPATASPDDQFGPRPTPTPAAPPASGGAGPEATDGFDVDPAMLRQFAKQLGDRIGHLAGRRHSLTDLAPLATRPAIFGDFPEAESLAQVQAVALANLGDLYDRLQEMIRFAESVLSDVANRYEQDDREVADHLHRVQMASVGRATS